MTITTRLIGRLGGAEVEEIPVSMSGDGRGVAHPIASVDAGDGAWVWVEGEIHSSPVNLVNQVSDLYVGEKRYSANVPRAGGGGTTPGSWRSELSPRALHLPSSSRARCTSSADLCGVV